jgi:hypothetical protein
MGEINHFKVSHYARLCGRWCSADLAIGDILVDEQIKLI